VCKGNAEPIRFFAKKLFYQAKGIS
jgi:hypothetical protein